MDQSVTAKYQHLCESPNVGIGKDKLFMEPSVFISYRRADSALVTGRIRASLAEHFDRREFFFDVDSLNAGDLISEKIRKALSKVSLQLVVVGKNWLEMNSTTGKPRLFDEHDYVRLEIETAISNKLKIIALLLDRASPPNVEALPQSLHSFPDQLGLPIRPEPDYLQDIDALCNNIRKQVPGIRIAPSIVRRRLLKSLLLSAFVFAIVIAWNLIPPSREALVIATATSVKTLFDKPREYVANPNDEVMNLYRDENDPTQYRYDLTQYRLRQALFLSVSTWRANEDIARDALDRILGEKYFKPEAYPDVEIAINSTKAEIQRILGEREEFLRKVKDDFSPRKELPQFPRSLRGCVGS